MRRFLFLILLLAPSLCWGQFATLSTGGTSDSIGVDVDGGAMDNWLYPAYLREGTNVTFTVTGDTLTIAGQVGVGTADTMWVHNDADDDSIMASNSAIHLEWGSGIDVTIVGNTATVVVDDAELTLSGIGGAVTDGQVPDSIAITLADGSVTYVKMQTNYADSLGNLYQDETIAGNWVNTASPWADNEIATSGNWNTAYGWGDHSGQGYITATLTEEEVEDYAGTMVDGGTETRIAVTYTDGEVGAGVFNFIVDDMNDGDATEAEIGDSIADHWGVFTAGEDASEADIHDSLAANWNTWLDDDDLGVDEAYGAGWNGDADSPEKDDVYDYLHLIDTDDDGDIGDETVTLSGNWVNTANPWAVNEGGTGAATFTDGGILLGSGTGAITALGAAANGQIPIGDGTTDPVLATVTGGTGITVTNGAGTISIANDFGTSIDLTSEVTGTLPEANGGTGDTDLDDIVGGAAITVTDGANTIIAGDATVALTVNTVDSTFIMPNAVLASELGPDAVHEVNIADDGIDSEHYNDGSIDLVHLATGVYARDIVTTAPVTGGTDNVLVGADGDVTLALDFTASWNFGGAAGLKIPAVDDPVTDEEGEIAWDTNNDAFEVFIGDESESALIPAYQKLDAHIFAPDGIDDEICIFRVDALVYPFGIEIDQVSITLPADAAYSMVFEEWAGDPPVAQNDIETVTTGGSDAYMEVGGGDIDDAAIDADDYIFLHVPNTDVDWIHVQIIYHVNPGD